MKIVIPMSGFGERFRKAGYTVPKPLIEIEGAPIIQHVREMFPGDHEFIFICSREHLENDLLRMREILTGLATRTQIVEVEPHKLGPVYAVSLAYDLIKDDEQVIVNYCDFTCSWSFEDFKAFVDESGSDACLPCYTGFHPHMLGTTNYAFLRHQGLWATDIKEKEPFTDDRMSEYASSGTFYFRSGRLLKKYFDHCMKSDLRVNGEFYVSMAMKPMIEDGLKVSIYELQHFMQWGTPEDVAEYNYYSAMFRGLMTTPQSVNRTWKGSIVLPMAGLGSRFATAGYTVTKPLIPVSGKPMVVQAALDLPAMEQQVFVLRKDIPGVEDVSRTLESVFPNSRQVMLEAVTDGQARTCMFGLTEGVSDDEPVMIGACDNGMLYSHDAFAALMEDPSVDVIVWAMRGYPGAAKNPKGYGWLDVDGDTVRAASVKVPLSDPGTDPIIVGAFTFKRAGDFRRCFEHLVESGVRVNGELYVDSMVNDALEMGLRVKTIDINFYLCWGTPNDLKTFEYWQSCFQKWDRHPYRLEGDVRVEPSKRSALAAAYAWKKPSRPHRVAKVSNG
jgi:NDP-sugar pyrophosphorylase family protein